MDNETHGTVWIGMFDAATKDGLSVLTLTMVQKALERDMDAIKAYCER